MLFVIFCCCFFVVFFVVFCCFSLFCFVVICFLLFLLLLFFGSLFFVFCCFRRDPSERVLKSTNSEHEIVQEPSMAKNSSPSRAPKTGAQLQTTWRSAKNASRPPKSPSHRHMTASGNNVQIFKCELRREAGTTNTMKYVKFFQKQRRLTHAVPDTARRNDSKFPSVNCKENRVHYSRRK